MLKRILYPILLATILLCGTVGTVTLARADKGKVKTSDIPITVSTTVSSPLHGGPLQLRANLHLVSQVTMAGDMATDFRLHANLFNSSASNLSLTQHFNAVGESSATVTPSTPVNP